MLDAPVGPLTDHSCHGSKRKMEKQCHEKNIMRIDKGASYGGTYLPLTEPLTNHKSLHPRHETGGEFVKADIV